MLKWLGRLILILVAVVASLIVVLGLAISIGIPISLDFARNEFEAMASKAIGRGVRIEGHVEIVPTWWPTLEVSGFRVAMPVRWPDAPELNVEGGGFARLEHAYLELAIFPLLFGEIRVNELSGSGVELHLERRPDGMRSWYFDLPLIAQEEESLEVEIEEPMLLDLVAIDRIAIRDVRLFYRTPEGQPWEYELSELEGVVSIDAPLQLKATGTFQDEPYSLEISGEKLIALSTGDSDWPMKLVMKASGATLELDGNITSRYVEATTDEVMEVEADEADEATGEAAKTPSADGEDDTLPSDVMSEIGPFQFSALALDLKLSGDRLDRFNYIARVQLPPLESYHAAGHLTLRNGRYAIEDLEVGVGSSRLTGAMSWDHLGEIPRAEVILRAHTIQLGDFKLESWSQATDEETEAAPSEPAENEPPSLLSPEVLHRANGRLAIDVDAVASGKDQLGNMHALVTVDDGRLTLFPFHLEVPGGRVEVELGYFEVPGTIALDLSIDMDHFEYGYLARYYAPETDMGGLISLDVELSTRARDVDTLLHGASGHVDAVIMPREFEAGVIDLWAVNLVATVLPTLDTAPKSVIECAIAQLDVNDGIVKQHQLLVDTTRMRVMGKTDIDLREETIELRFEPIAKKPEFFSLATPVSVSGKIDDFRVGVRPEDVMGTVIRFITSVVVVPIQRLAGIKTDLTDDAICERSLARNPDAPDREPEQ